MVEHLRSTGYDLTHPDIQRYADHLYHYGVGTLVDLHKAGKLFAACRRNTRGGGLSPPPVSWTVEARRVIAETVCAAIEGFLTQSVRRWDPDQASMATYFVNYCLQRFKTHYQRFCREEAHTDTERPVDNLIDFHEARERVRTSPEDIAVAKAMQDEITSYVGSTRFTRYLQLALTDVPKRKIAAELGLSESALSHQVARWRKTVEDGGWPAREGE